MSKRRRIFAEQPQQVAEISLSQLLFEQQLGWHSSTYLSRRYVEVAVRRLKLQGAYDTYNEGSTAAMPLPYMQQRSAVLEIVVHVPLLFVLVNSGLCSVFNMDGGECLGYLNAGPHDIIRSIVFNSWTSSILAVSFHATETSLSNQLYCTSVPACSSSFSVPGRMYCPAGQPICDPVTYPGFLEFDETAPRALLFHATTMQYKVYDLSNPSYNLLYCLAGAGVTEVKMSSKYLLVARMPHHSTQQQQECTAEYGCMQLELQQQTHTPENGQQQQQQVKLVAVSGEAVESSTALPLEVISSVSGMVLCRHELPAAANCKAAGVFEVLELFGAMLLVKQALQPFKIYNVLNMALQGTSNAEALSQVSSFLYLPQQHMFMTVSYHTLTTWNFKAQVVASFEDHDLWYPDATDDPLVYITQDWVMSYCRPKGSSTTLPPAGAVGSIHISNVVTGKLLAKLEAPIAEEEVCHVQQHRLLCHQPAPHRPQPQQGEMGSAGQLIGCAGQLNTLLEALTDITAVMYDEQRHVAYTGNHAGVVHKWTPG